MSEDEAIGFVDTNILVCAFEKEDSESNRVSRNLLNRLMQTDTLRLSTQVLQEFYVTMTRKSRDPASSQETLACINDLSHWTQLTIDYSAVRDACLLNQDASISFWDALIVVAAARTGAQRLYTEDLNHGQRSIIPFLVARENREPAP